MLGYNGETTIANLEKCSLVDVFLSYARNDSAFADRLSKALSDEGINVWLDKDSIKPGDLWISVISKAIQNSNVFIPIISKQYSASNYLNSEIAAAVAAQANDPSRKIIPILVEKNAQLPSFIDQYQFLDLSEDRHFLAGISTLKNIIISEAPNYTPPMDIESIRAGRDMQISTLQSERAAFDELQQRKNVYIRYYSFIALAATMIGFIAASVLLFYSPEQREGISSIMILLFSTLTGFLGTIIGYYFGSSTKAQDKDPRNEVPE